MLILLGALFLSSATLVAAQTEGISTERPYTDPTGSTGRPYTGPTGSTGLPYYGSTGNTGRPYTGPTGSTGLPFSGPTGSTGRPYTGPTGSTGRPYTGPTGSTALPFTGPTGSTRFPYSGPTSSTGLPYYGSTGSTGRPYTGPTGSTGLPATGRTSAAPVTAAPVTDTDNYCKCGIVDGWFDDWDPSTIWVDVIIILDTSKSMGESLEEAKSVITSFVGLMSTDVTAEFYSRIGVIAMSDSIEVIYNLNMTSSDNLDSVHQNKIDKIDVGDAFQAALQMFADGTKLPSYRANAVQLIYYLTNSAPGTNMNGVDDFKTGGGIIIVNDFVLEGEVPDPGLQKLASDNFFFTDLSENYINSLGVFCEANCFCSPDAHPFNDDDISPRTRANRGCFHPVNNGIPQQKARETCQKEGGGLVCIHDSQKEFFVNSVISIFGPKKKYWLGLEYDGAQWNWDDNSTSSFSDWDIGNGQPNTNGGKLDCAYAQQGTGFNTPWTAANCAMGGVLYVCESRPCSIGYKNCS